MKTARATCRALRDHPNATSYAMLSAFAAKNAKNEIGCTPRWRLGYYDPPG